MRLFFLSSLLCLLSCNENIFHSLDEESQISILHSKGWETENFILEEKPSLVDLLIVADTSPSMYHRLSHIGRSLSDIFSAIFHYDWQVAITSADHGDHADPSRFQQSWRDHILEPGGRFGGLMNLENDRRILQTKILTPQIPNYEQVFLHSLSHESQGECHRPPYCHNRLEQPLRSLKSAIQRASLDNRYFFRPTADFVSIIITNERERAEDRSRATKAEQVARAFEETFGHLNKKFIAFNIIIMDQECLAVEKSNTEVADIAHSIAELAEITGGYNISICSPNYGVALRQLSKHIKNTLENSILLKKEPVSETVQVDFINGEELIWTQSGRNIVFEDRRYNPLHVSISYQTQN